MNEEYEKLFSLESVKNEMEIHKWLFDYVNQHTGINATRPIELMIMYFTLAEQVRQSFMQNETKVHMDVSFRKAWVYAYQNGVIWYTRMP